MGELHSIDLVALQTVIGLKFVKKKEIVLIQYSKSSCDSKMFWTVLLCTSETVRLKQNITAKDILESLQQPECIQVSQTIILNINFLTAIELKTRKCLLIPPFETIECYVSRLYLKNIRQQFELAI